MLAYLELARSEMPVVVFRAPQLGRFSGHAEGWFPEGRVGRLLKSTHIVFA